MAHSGEQIDKGTLRIHCTASEKRQQKKIHKKAKRRQAKDIDSPNPQHNRYRGYIV